MEKCYHSYIKKFQVLPKSTLYNEDSKYMISEFNKHEATLYLIVKTPKIAFIPESFIIDDNYNLCGEVFIENTETIKAIKFNPLKIPYDMPQLRNNYPTLESFINTYMDMYEDGNKSNKQKYKDLSSIDLNNSNESKLRIKCPISKAVTRGEGDYMDLKIYQVINFFNIDILQNLEILYIGKSNDNTWQRLYSHNKWGFLEEYRNKAKEDFLVYFLQLDYSKLEINKINNFAILNRGDDTQITLEDATKITEASLINYFIKEKKFNDQMVNMDLSKWYFIKTKLKNNGYTEVNVELYLDGLFGKLGTDNTKYKGYHNMKYKI